MASPNVEHSSEPTISGGVALGDIFNITETTITAGEAATSNLFSRVMPVQLQLIAPFAAMRNRTSFHPLQLKNFSHPVGGMDDLRAANYHRSYDRKLKPHCFTDPHTP